MGAQDCQLLPRAPSIIAKDQGCDAYMEKTGCGWTTDWNCPGQPTGKKGPTGNDGSLGYNCCCSFNLWNQTHVTVTGLAGAWQKQNELQTARDVASWPIAAGLATA